MFNLNYNFMVHQTSVHLKLDNGLLSRLNAICYSACVNRNYAINKMIETCLFCCELQLEKSKSVHFFVGYGKI